ncbi:MAG: prepilin-type N-terminal cleavage/methylation domain-containing protein [Candidatus Electryonea clarkiae]|nr:prepilin-type N-terminal cleavage/methylation domain-containing protein [Candidatus Electryonea clarkiae]MDP8288698.1 prepilin-type N-terminal cleavage/methylation domain-containing protein [Candidatus Electryonea clarkiae]
MELNRSRKGFTLIEILVVVVIIAILAAISVPIYIEYVRGARAADAQSQIGAIYNAAKMYVQDRDRSPTDINELEEFGYLNIDESVHRSWQFTVNWPETIEAVSTDEMRGGAGKMITYDVLQGIFYGYGLPTDGETEDF